MELAGPLPEPGKEEDMRDEMEARLWTAHHGSFSGSVDAGLRALGRRLGNIRPGRLIPGQLIAILLAASFSLATIGGTVA